MLIPHRVFVVLIAVLFFIIAIPAVPYVFLIYGEGFLKIQNPIDIVFDWCLKTTYLATPFLMLISGVGLILFKKWGRVFGIATAVCISFDFLFPGVLNLFYNSPPDLNFSYFCFGLALMPMLIAFYLMQPSVKKLFLKVPKEYLTSNP